MAKQADLITFAELARRLKISRSMVSKAKNRGVFNGALILVPGKKFPMLDAKKALKLYNSQHNAALRKEFQTPQRKEKGGNGAVKDSDGKTLVAAKSDVERLKAAKLKFEQEQRQGLWLDKAKVTDQAFKAARLMRDNLLNIPSRIAALVSAESDQHNCYQIIHQEIKVVLDEYVNQLKAIAK